MFETVRDGVTVNCVTDFAGWSSDVAEPDWDEHPVYSSIVSDSERLDRALELSPAGRPTGELARLDVRVLSPAQRIDLLGVLEEQKNWLESVQARVLAEIDAADASKLNLGQEAVSLVLKVPLRVAQNRLKTGRSLVGELPKTLQLLQKGKISRRHAELISQASWRLEPELVATFEARVTERAEQQTVPQLQQSVSRATLALGPATAEVRHQKALRDRRVGFQPCDDGMVQLPVLLGAAEGQQIFTRLTAAATLLPAADPRTMDQKRADLLVDAVLSGLPSDSLPELCGRRPGIQVIVSADTLLGCNDEPGDLAGYGPITAETARRLAADQSGTWRRLLTDPDTGHLLDISADQYRPSQRLRNFVDARDGVCTFPTCNQPGYRCEFEHIVPYLRGGKTCRCNGALACKRHNLCKIDTGWSYTFNADGSFTWISEDGHRYTSHPPERWKRPDHAAEPEPPPRQTVEQVCEREDRAYAKLDRRWQDELECAQQAGDEALSHRALQAIGRAEQQRCRDLAHRADPSCAPF